MIPVETVVFRPKETQGDVVADAEGGGDSAMPAATQKQPPELANGDTRFAKNQAHRWIRCDNASCANPQGRWIKCNAVGQYLNYQGTDHPNN